MDEHVSFDELQTFVFAEKLTPAIIRLGAKINSHVLSCDECADQYNAWLELRAQNEKKVQQVEESLEQNADSLTAQRSLIEEIMSDSQNEERPQEREGPSQKPRLSHSR